jgi:ABC-type transport system substrate-binding protein
MFTWVESPGSKITAKDKLACGGEINYGNYCNKKASAILQKVATDLDENDRTKLLNQAESMMVKDVPSIPMFVRPVFTIAAKQLKGLTTPTTLEGDFWNVSTWTTSS